ncbi:hypothetical protein [Chelativorans alearense]|uniref:hypothetical protein n=1 Tax=Chelativorans alearense TaxID=2681495 RepID=UPI0013CF8326|nr:hypothetical protein [Chelativorans alearense]
MSALLVGLLMRVLGLDEAAARSLGTALLVGVAVAGLAGGITWLKRQGADEALNKIERQDHEAGRTAAEARDGLRRCFERGGVQRPRSGQCDR